MLDLRALTAAAVLLAEPCGALVIKPNVQADYDLPGVKEGLDGPWKGATIYTKTSGWQINAADGFYQPTTKIVAVGTVEMSVMRGRNGLLTFSWRVTNNPKSQVTLDRIEVGWVPLKPYDVNWRTDSAGEVVPSKLGVNPLPQAVYLNFRFQGAGIAPGQSSKTFFIHTLVKTMDKISVTPLRDQLPLTYAGGVLSPGPGKY